MNEPPALRGTALSLAIALGGAAAIAVFHLPSWFGTVATSQLARAVMLIGVVANVAAGVALARWRPNSRLWALTTALSIAWSCFVLALLSVSVINGPANAAILLRPLTFFLLLSWPTGHLRRGDRIWWAAYSATQATVFFVVPQLVVPGDGRVLAVADLPRLATVLQAFGSSVVLPVGSVLLVVSVSRHAARLSSSGRRLHRPVVHAARLVCVSELFLVASDLVGEAAFVDGVPTMFGGLVQTLDYAKFAVPALCVLEAARRASTIGATTASTIEIGASSTALRTLLASTAARSAADVVFPTPDGTWVDRDGRPVGDEPAPGAIELRRDDEVVAVIVLRDGEQVTAEEIERLVAATGASLDLARVEALANARRLDALRAQRAIVTAHDAARSRLERDLHDGAQQRLVAMALQASMAARARADDDSVAVELRGGVRLARTEMAEAAAGALPALVAAHGLGAAIATLASTSALEVSVEVRLPSDVPPEVAAAAWFVVAEATANATKHAQARHIHITGEVDDAVGLVVAVEDDGRGGVDTNGSGLRGLAARVARAGGRLDVASSTGEGTRITARFPVVAGVPS